MAENRPPNAPSPEGPAPRPVPMSQTWGPPPVATPGVPPPSPSAAGGTAPSPFSGPAIPAPDPETLREWVIEVLETIFDPEIPVNVWELGLVYDLTVSPERDVAIRMTLTSPACPVAETLPPEVEQKVREIPGVKSVKLELVWDPPWSMSRLSEAARLQLGFL